MVAKRPMLLISEKVLAPPRIFSKRLMRAAINDRTITEMIGRLAKREIKNDV